VQCVSSSQGFAVENVYKRADFSSRTLSGNSIGVGPVLTRMNVDLGEHLKYDEILKYIKKIRRDLVLISFEQIQKELLAKDTALKIWELKELLNDSTVINLQNNDSLWQHMSCNYFMLIRFKNGMKIKGINKTTRQRLQCEAELWHCKDQEVVWRILINGASHGSSVTDKEFILNSIGRIYSELPNTIPVYENKDW
jgi:hypothetical protein